MWASLLLKMAQIKSWTLSEVHWRNIEPLVPLRKRMAGRNHRNKPKGGPDPMHGRHVLVAHICFE